MQAVQFEKNNKFKKFKKFKKAAWIRGI